MVGRICLDVLRARKAHRVEYVGSWLPEPLVVEPAAGCAAHPGPTRTWACSAERSARSWPPPGNGDFEALLEVLAPDVVVHFDLGPDREPQPTLVGARTVARHVLQTAPRFAAYARPAMVNGTAGLLFGPREEPFAVLGFTVSEGRIAELDMVEPGA